MPPVNRIVLLANVFSGDLAKAKVLKVNKKMTLLRILNTDEVGDFVANDKVRFKGEDLSLFQQLKRALGLEKKRRRRR